MADIDNVARDAHTPVAGAGAFPALLGWLESLPAHNAGHAGVVGEPMDPGVIQARTAAVELAKILQCHAGPVRVGACTVAESLELPDLGPGWLPVAVSWPVLTHAVDVVLVGWSATVDKGSIVDAKARARMRGIHAESAVYFHVVEEEVLRGADVGALREVVEGIDPARIEQVRLLRLAREVAALRQRFPHAGLPACEFLPAPVPLRVSVISPDKRCRGSWVARARELGEMVSPLSPVDVIIAVAPATGWRSADKEVLKEAVARAGIVFVTARLPSSWQLPHVLLEESYSAKDLYDVVDQVLKAKTPVLRAASVSPLSESGQAVGVAKHHMLLRRRKVLVSLPERHLRHLARSLEIPRSWRTGVVEACMSVVVAGVVAGGLIRVGVWPAVAIVVGAVLAGVRLMQAKRVRRTQLAAEIAGELGARVSVLSALPKRCEGRG